MATDATISPAVPSGTASPLLAAPKDDAPKTDDATAAAAGDFQTFLTLLTAQMRNQDPLKPIDSTEFVTQLASFSSVEQQIGANDRLDSILEALGGGAGAGLSDWIGKDVQAAAQARFDGETAVNVAVAPLAGAARAVLIVRDAGGAQVARLDVDPSAETLTWAGETGGETAAAGAYRLSVEYLDERGLLGISDGLVFAEVTELRLGGAEPRLVLAGGAEIAASEVKAVRARSSPDA